MPAWVETGFQTYQQRLPQECKLKLIEIPTAKRHKSAVIEKLMQQEADALLAAIPEDSFVIALDQTGKQFPTEKLANELTLWQQQYQHVCLLVGGPDGLAARCLERANMRWSLSLLTLPHPLVRVVLAEQIYRAWSILVQHPYHR